MQYDLHTLSTNLNDDTTKNDVEVVKSILTSVIVFCKNDHPNWKENREYFRNFNLKLLSKLVLVIEIYKVNVDVVLSGMEAIKWLCNACTDHENRTQLGASGACELVMELLQSYGKEDSQIATECVGALGCLSWSNASNQDIIGIRGGCSLLLELIPIHLQDSSAVQQDLAEAISLACVRLIKGHEGNRILFKNLDGKNIIRTNILWNSGITNKSTKDWAIEAMSLL